jgi:hypothetical protein
VGERVPSDVEHLPEGVEDGEDSGVVLDEEDDRAEDRDDPADGEADHPAEDARLQGALACLEVLLQGLVAPLLGLLEDPLRLIALVALISHKICRQGLRITDLIEDAGQPAPAHRLPTPGSAREVRLTTVWSRQCFLPKEVLRS